MSIEDLMNLLKANQDWLQYKRTHYHVGEPVEIFHRFDNSRSVQKKLIRKNDFLLYMIDPAGDKKDLDITVGDNTFDVISFTPEREGYYHVVVEQNGTINASQTDNKNMNFTKYMRVFIPVGHDLGNLPCFAGNSLEIQPLQWKLWRAGDTIKVKVSHVDEPVSPAAVTLTYINGDKEIDTKEAGKGGIVEFYPEKPGYYLLSTNKVEQRSENGFLGYFGLLDTLTMMVIK